MMKSRISSALSQHAEIFVARVRCERIWRRAFLQTARRAFDTARGRGPYTQN
jgi:hypothetical protein